ncbi:MAG: hypothetical protein AAB817_01145, partial [Patescibacteria group bacterium]
PDHVYQLIDWDVNASLDAALNVGHSGNQLLEFFAPLYHLTVAPVNIDPDYVLSETRLIDALRDAYPNAESEGTPTDFVFVGSGETMTVTVVEAVEGAVLDYESALNELTSDAKNLSLDTLELRLVERSAG